jgi:hypothetical protein
MRAPWGIGNQFNRTDRSRKTVVPSAIIGDIDERATKMGDTSPKSNTNFTHLSIQLIQLVICQLTLCQWNKTPWITNANCKNGLSNAGT